MKYTKELLEVAVSENTGISGVIRYLGAKPSGGLHHHLTRRIRQWGIDTSHFVGQAHLKGKNHPWPKKKPLGAVLVVDSTYNRGHLKRRLIKDGLLKNECALCGQLPEWNDNPLVLVLDHINGINDDNQIGNLRLLCPNCNSQQKTFCRKHRRGGMADTSGLGSDARKSV